MCGDYMCPSCGPAQGYNPTYELIFEWLANKALNKKYDISEEYDIEAAIDAVMRLLEDEQEVVAAMIKAVKSAN
jgi:hypothetical protein